jgi:hypothetical protein
VIASSLAFACVLAWSLPLPRPLIRFSKCSTTTSHARQSALSPLRTQLCPRRLTLDEDSSLACPRHHNDQRLVVERVHNCSTHARARIHCRGLVFSHPASPSDMDIALPRCSGYRVPLELFNQRRAHDCDHNWLGANKNSSTYSTLSAHDEYAHCVSRSSCSSCKAPATPR